MEFINYVIIIGQVGFIMCKQLKVNLENDVGLSVVELIRKYEYPIEIYSNVQTEDQYLLDVFRIPHGRIKRNESGMPILLMHGLMGSARDFIAMGPEKSLAYLLADRGYDVWLGNARGTTYSRKHLRLNPSKDSQFWKFSMHEIGIYDLPAILDLVMKTTKKEELSYLGHSQGTSVFYILTSTKPEYNDHINIMVSLAPVAYLGHMYSPILRFIARFEPMLTWLSQAINIQEIPPFPMRQLLAVVNKLFCTIRGLFQDMCALLFHLTGGYSPTHLTKSALPIFLSDGLGGASSFQALQYAQLINSGKFKPFDWGKKINLQRYGSTKPQDYKINNIVVPIGVYYAYNDWLTNWQDVLRFCSELPNCIHKYKVPSKDFNHYDFVVAHDIIEMVYNDVFELLDERNKKS